MSFLPPVTRDVMTPDDAMVAADQMVTPFGAYGAASLKEGFIGSWLGELVHTAPDPLGEDEALKAAKARAEGIPSTNMTQALDEESFKTSPNYRPGMPWSPGMTEARAAALASDVDAAAWRQNLYQKYQGGLAGKAGGLAAQFIGGALSPENYIPFFGPAARAGMIARLGTVGGHAALAAGEGLLGTALVEPSIYGFNRDRGQDYGLADIGADLLFGTAIGGAFGALHGGYSALRGPRITPRIIPGGIPETVPGEAVAGVEARAAGPAVFQAPAEPAPAGERVAGEAVPPAEPGGMIAPELTRSPRPAGDVLTPPVLARETDALNAAADALSRGEPVDVGAMVPDRPEPEPGSFIDVFHGTPHTFAPEEGHPGGRFNEAAIGTGEGAQAYGHGLYFAEHRGIGESYMGSTGELPKTAGGQPFDMANPEHVAAGAVASAGSRSAAIDLVKSAIEEGASSGAERGVTERALEILQSGQKLLDVDRGNLYGVRLHVRPDELLHWDKPLSEQPAKVREAVNKLGYSDPEKTGESVYYSLIRKLMPDNLIGASETQNAQRASAALRDAGIPGIRYLDAGSRGPTEAPTHNIVLFDPSRAEITHVNDRAVERPIPPPPSVVEAAPRVGKGGDELKTFAEDAGLEGFKAPTLEEQAKAEEAKAKAAETGKPAPEKVPTPLDGELQALRDAGRLTPEDEALLREADNVAKDAESYAAAYETLPNCINRFGL